jgi:hypothetical protein
MTTLITLVLPIGGDAGPFDLYSNVGGYAIPFETNISASALQAGYTSYLVPNGTTIIRVTSVGVCTNSIDITVGLTPTTTTTSSSSSSTSTTTSTAVPTTTTTSSSTSSSTSTSSTTTTTTTCACLYGSVTIDQVDIDASDDGTVYVQYQDCDGHGFCDPETPCVGGVPYTVAGVYPNDICILNTSTPTCPTSIYIITGGLCNVSEGGSTVILGGCCTSPPTTTTTTTLACISYLATISSGSGNVGYTDCNGDPGFGDVFPLEPLSFCALEGTQSGSVGVVITDNGPCTSPEVGCYTITFNPDTECPGDPGHVTVSYTECNGTQVIGEVINTGGTSTRCALVGGSELQPAYVCGTGTISLGAACIQLGLISSASAPSDACPLPMPIDCWISGTGSPNAGDVIYLDAAMTTVLEGDGGYYHFELAISPGVTYSALVNILGTIESFGFTICP